MNAIFQRCGIALTSRQLDLMWAYHGLLRQSNQELNLTRIHNFTNMVIKLYADSLLPVTLVDLPSPLMDLGSGPGMPGIPLKIWRPELQIVLAEGRAKRCEFLRRIIASLHLEGISVLDRNVSPEVETPVAGVITRAVEKVADTLERVSGCLSRGGQVVFMKGPGCEAEIAAAAGRFADRFRLVADKAYTLGDTDHRRRLLVYERLTEPARIIRQVARQRFAVQVISSPQNDRFKDLKKLLGSRGIKKSGRALVAGLRQVSEVLTQSPRRCLAWIDCEQRQPPPVEAPDSLQWWQLTESLFRQLDVFGTGTPLLLVEIPEVEEWTPAEGFEKGCSLLVPFQDPENIGAVIRSAAAFGVRQVILLSESAHPCHPRALRASGGAALTVRIRKGPSLERLPVDLPVVALSPEGRDLDQVQFPTAFGLLVGLEGPGLPESWRAAAVRIPIHPRVESLNAATAAAIALYAWRRQAERKQTEKSSGGPL